MNRFSGGRGHAFRLLLLLLSTGATLAGLEWLLRQTRIGAPEPAFVTAAEYLQLREISTDPGPEPELIDGFRYARDLPGTGGFPLPPGRFAVPKPEGTLRIFAFGGSTTFGLPITQGAGRNRDLSFPAWLRLRLARSLPGRAVEVINVGAVAQTFEGATQFALECLRYEPDGFLFYSGHNEYLPHALLLSRARVASSLVLAGDSPLLFTRLGRLWQNFMVSWQERRNPALGSRDFPEVTEMIGPCYHSPAEVEVIERGLLDLLGRLEEECRQRGIPLFVCTPASNLSDFEPSLSYVERPTTPEQVAGWTGALVAAGESLRAGDPAQARALLQALDGEAHELAEYQFQSALVRAQEGDPRSAFEHFVAARDRDGVIRRAPSGITEAIRRFCQRSSAHLIDTERALWEAAAPDAPGLRWFFDHVHPTIEGTRVLVDCIERRLLEELAPDARPDPRSTEEELGALGYQPEMNAVICTTEARAYGGLLLLRLYDPQRRLAAARSLVEQVPPRWPQAFAEAQITLGFLEVLSGWTEAGKERLLRFGGPGIKKTAAEFVESSGSLVIERIFREAGLLP